MNFDPMKMNGWDRLIRRVPLDGLQLNTKEGRTDLSGLELTLPARRRGFKFNRSNVAQVEPSAIVQETTWQNIDITGSKLDGLRLINCRLDNCIFDNCELRDLRVWSTTILDTSFHGADLRRAALGGVEDGERNSFLRVDFTEADLRQTAYTAAAFDECIFRNAKLEKIDFQTSTFSNCIFEGVLTDVLFYRRAFNGEQFPPNEMRGVDFSRAKLRHVEFRGLSLDSVLLPNDMEYIVVNNYAATLDAVIENLRTQQDSTSKKLFAYLSVFKKWAIPGQVRGVLNIGDIAEVAGPGGVETVRKLLAR
jgi:uncharacterized protein YjbI with pentapeptide repeats